VSRLVQIKFQRQIQLDLTYDGSGGGSRIVDENQELPASIAWTSGVVIGGTERRSYLRTTHLSRKYQLPAELTLEILSDALCC